MTVKKMCNGFFVFNCLIVPWWYGIKMDAPLPSLPAAATAALLLSTLPPLVCS